MIETVINQPVSKILLVIATSIIITLSFHYEERAQHFRKYIDDWISKYPDRHKIEMSHLRLKISNLEPLIDRRKYDRKDLIQSLKDNKVEYDFYEYLKILDTENLELTNIPIVDSVNFYYKKLAHLTIDKTLHESFFKEKTEEKYRLFDWFGIPLMILSSLYFCYYFIRNGISYISKS